MTSISHPQGGEGQNIHAIRLRRVGMFLRQNVFAVTVLGLVILAGIFAPMLSSTDPHFINPAVRLRPPSAEFLFGTDPMGRDIWARVLIGTRASLAVGLLVALIALVVGLMIGLVSGYFPALDGVIMRLMDGIMAIPAIILAVALVAVMGANFTTVVTAIVVPEVPRVARLVRSVVLSLRSEPFVEAAISMATPTWRILLLHMLPNTLAPLTVQGSFIIASAILTESALSFLGVGLPPEIPTWGNIMAEGRRFFQLFPGLVLFPGIFLSLTVLAINLLGDGLRDTLDPKLVKRI
ncbi:ABC transporter permease [Pararhodobacter sp.]|uniref:ABC transporter permease n=1 Tax=Pararhodobacter sp. TaxID=2127056 RepID=UPI002FDD4C57